MSRSNPQENSTPNPSQRWFEWNGEAGTVRYYDKDAKKTVDVGSDFTFILLDQLATVRGWHEASESSIYANEVRDTTQDVLVVKSFKGGTLIEGIYKNIKDRVNALGGSYVANCYIAFKDGGRLSIGSLRFKGSALAAWMEFTKANRADLYTKAIRINGYTEGKKGRIVYRMPKLSTVPLSEKTDQEAVGLDLELQAYLKTYFQRTRRDQADVVPATQAETDVEQPPEYDDADLVGSVVNDDDVPF